MSAEVSNMDKIVEGVVTGVGAGVVVALILGVYGWVQRSCRRREQIHYIRTVIEKAEDDIQQAGPLVPGEGEALQANTDQVRFTIYQWLMRILTIALEDRSGALSYKQRYELKEFIMNLEGLTGMFPAGRVPGGMRFYEQNVFNKLYSLEWLDSKRQPPQV